MAVHIPSAHELRCGLDASSRLDLVCDMRHEGWSTARLAVACPACMTTHSVRLHRHAVLPHHRTLHGAAIAVARSTFTGHAAQTYVRSRPVTLGCDVQLLRRCTAVSVGRWTVTLHGNGAASGSTTAPVPVGVILQSDGLNAAAGPSAARDCPPAATLCVQPLTVSLLIRDSPASTTPADGAAPAGSPLQTPYAGSVPAPVPEESEQPTARSMIIAQLSSASITSADASAGENVFGGLGTPVDTRATPGRPITAEARVTSGGDASMHADVTICCAVLVVDAEGVPAVHSVVAHVFAPAVGGSGSSGGGGSVSTAGNGNPPPPPAPPGVLHAGHPAASAKRIHPAPACPADPQCMTCAVAAGPFAVALLLPNPAASGATVALVTQARVSASADVRQNAARCQVELPEVTLHAAPAAVCCAVCEGSQPLELRPVCCVAEVSQVNASLTAQHGGSQHAQHAAGRGPAPPAASTGLPTAHAAPEAGGSTAVTMEVIANSVRVVAGAEEVSVGHNLMHALAAIPAAGFSPSEAANSACSTGTPPASQHRSLTTSLPLPTATVGSQESSYGLAPVQITVPPQMTLVDTIVDAAAATLGSLRAAARWSLRCTVQTAAATVLQRHAVGGCGCMVHVPHAWACPLHPNALARGGLVVTPLVTVEVRPQRQRQTITLAASSAGVSIEATTSVQVMALNTLCQEMDVLVEEWPLQLRASMHPNHASSPPVVRSPPPHDHALCAA